MMPRWFRVCAKREQHAQDFVDVATLHRARHVLRTAERGDERRETISDRSIGIGADFEQRADEGTRAVVDRVYQALADRGWHAPVRYCGRIVECRAQTCHVAFAKSLVYLPEPFRIRAPFFFSQSFIHPPT